MAEVDRCANSEHQSVAGTLATGEEDASQDGILFSHQGSAALSMQGSGGGGGSTRAMERQKTKPPPRLGTQNGLKRQATDAQLRYCRHGSDSHQVMSTWRRKKWLSLNECMKNSGVLA